MRAVQAPEPGGPEVLTVVDLPETPPRAGEVRVQVAAAGVNFIDTYQRSGIYAMDFPHVVGSEGAGTVVEVGAGVTELVAGDRIAWASVAGSYAERVNVPVSEAIPVPAAVDLRIAAALPLQGMTAHYLSSSTYPVSDGDVALVHAAAGGVGLLLTQLVRRRGGRVIGTVSTAEKEALARQAGADEVVRYTELDDLTAELPPIVRGLTGGRGVDVVYDGVGNATFDASLASLRRRGMLVLFGGASGQVPPLDLQRLNSAGSLFVTRPKLGDYTVDRVELLWRAADLFAAVTAGLSVRIGAEYPLAAAGDAHRALESRQTTGKVVLLP